MLNSKFLGACALATLFESGMATVAPNFPIGGGEADLTITFGNNTISPAGELIPRADAATPPTITTADIPLDGSAVLMIVDQDVPRNGSRIQLLHWLIADVTVSDSNLVIPPESSALATYIQPNPPVGDTPHAYNVLIFAQPDDFSVPPAFAPVVQTRIGFDTAAFAEAAGLGDALAANYFRVQNTSGTATTTFPPPASAPTNGSSPGSPDSPEFPGAAATVGDRAWLMGVGTAVAVGLAAVML